MTVEDWQAVGIVSGALLAVLTLLGLLYRKLVLPMFRGLRRGFKRADESFDEILGDKAKGIPSLKEQMAKQGQQLAVQGEQIAEQGNQIAELAQQIAEHLEWHAAPGGRPAAPTPAKPNSTPPRRTR